jgi:hypothetical protein
MFIPDNGLLENPLDPLEAEYSVTGLMRRETCGSMCKALFRNMVIQAGSGISKQVW